MKLEEIGFYTLSNSRALSANHLSPLSRAELILTDSCNLKCVYCRGISQNYAAGTISKELALQTLEYWTNENLKNIRFSGGEPTIHPNLLDLVSYCKSHKVERIAISTNGTADLSLYKELIDAGINDFSISLDSGCCAISDKISGVSGKWRRVVNNIKALSALTYVTVGMVFNEINIDSCVQDVLFASSLGVSDIRIIPSAQYNLALRELRSLPQNVLSGHPILKYRIQNINNDIPVRGIKDSDCHKCYIVLDDIMSAQGYHFPCIIHFREGGQAIGKMNSNFRKDRLNWFKNHNSFNDEICKKNCLDCIVKYNNIAGNN